MRNDGVAATVTTGPIPCCSATDRQVSSHMKQAPARATRSTSLGDLQEEEGERDPTKT